MIELVAADDDLCSMLFTVIANDARVDTLAATGVCFTATILAVWLTAWLAVRLILFQIQIDPLQLAKDHIIVVLGSNDVFSGADQLINFPGLLWRWRLTQIKGPSVRLLPQSAPLDLRFVLGASISDRW